MIQFIIGLFIGAFAGILLSASCKVAKDADTQAEEININGSDEE